MRKLTMLGFLSQYVRELAEADTLNVQKLYSIVQSGNYRLKEPLFLYCYYNKKADILTRYLNASDMEEFLVMVKVVESGNFTSLLPNYVKVFNAYEYQYNKHDNETRIKMLMVKKITRLQTEKGVSNYRVYTDLRINPGNYDSFVKGRNYSKLSLNKSREILNYLERL